MTTHSRFARRPIHGAIASLLLAATMAALPGTGLAAVQLRESGVHGAYSVTDTSTHPGARCRYEGAAGSWYLRRIRVHAPTIYGASATLRSVGYRALLQRHTAHGWKTVQRGRLVSGAASTSTAATLTGSGIRRDLQVAPNGARYRAALKLIWWDKHAHREGTVLLALKHHRRSFDASVGRVCRGRVPIS